MQHIRHIFFDLDHTLWDFNKNSGLTFKKIFELNQLNVNLKDFLEVYEPINFKYWKLYREEKVTKSELRYSRLREAFDSVGCKVSDEMIYKLSVSYIERLTTFSHLHDGAVDILQYLEVKYDLHIITNGFEEAQERKMKNSAIRHYFKTITNSEMAGVKKPDPKIFEFALENAKADPGESLMIGDSLEADIEGAFNVGMDAILFNESKQNRSASGLKVVDYLKDLKTYL